MAAVISSVMSTKDKVPFFVNRCEEMGIEVLPPGRQLLRPRLRGQRQVDPVRARRGQERRPPGGRGDHRGARARRPVLLDLGLLRAGRRAGRQQAGGRVPDQVRGARLDGRQSARGCSRCCPRPRRAPRSPRRTRAAARARSSTSAARRPPARGAPAGGLARPPAAGPRPRSSTSASCCGSRRRPSGPSSPRTRWARFATRCASGWTARSTRRSARRTAPGSRSAGSSARASACELAAAPT